MMKKFFCIMVMALALVACGIGDTNTTYDRTDIGQAGIVSLGTIVSMNPIKTAGTNSVGTLSGGIAGAAAGSMIGGNTAINIIGGVGGAVLGGVLGAKTEEALTKDTAMEFIVRTENGKLISIVQSNELGLRVGDQVMLSTVSGTTRIRSRAGI